MLNITDETAPLTDLCVFRGTSVPEAAAFHGTHAEYQTFPMQPWNRDLLLRQQDAFHEVLMRRGVRLHQPAHSDAHPWQLYTRDTGFVIGARLYYAEARALPERAGEIALIRAALPPVEAVALPDRIEGGDVLVDDDIIWVGLGTRTTPAAAAALGDALAAAGYPAEVVPVPLGPTVMHLDTRMTILPGAGGPKHALICTAPFGAADLVRLRARYRFIEVTGDEALAMGTNVFVIDPETVVVHAGFPRIAAEIEAAGLRVERVDFSEPNALLGSFRCATMPLARAR